MMGWSLVSTTKRNAMRDLTKRGVVSQWRGSAAARKNWQFLILIAFKSGVRIEEKDYQLKYDARTKHFFSGLDMVCVESGFFHVEASILLQMFNSYTKKISLCSFEDTNQRWFNTFANWKLSFRLFLYFVVLVVHSLWLLF